MSKDSDSNKITPGEWYAQQAAGNHSVLVASEGDERGETLAVFSGRSMAGDSALAITAVNACKRINPDNPLAVAESIEDLVTAAEQTIANYEALAAEHEDPLESPPPFVDALILAVAKIKGE